MKMTRIAVCISAALVVTGCSTRVMVEPSNSTYLASLKHPALGACDLTKAGANPGVGWSTDSWQTEYDLLAASAVNTWNKAIGLGPAEQPLRNVVKLEPGMVLRISGLLAGGNRRLTPLDGTNSTSSGPEVAIAEIEWEIPEPTMLTRRDFAVLRFLLEHAGSRAYSVPGKLEAADAVSIAATRRGFAAMVGKQGKAGDAGSPGQAPDSRELATRRFLSEYAMQLADVSSFEFHLKGQDYDHCTGATARTLREMLYARHPGYAAGTPFLVFKIGDRPKLAVVETDADWYFAGDASQGSPLNFEVDIAVKVDGDPQPRKVPLGTSFVDFEKRYGVRVTSFKRQRALVCGEENSPHCSLAEFAYNAKIPPAPGAPEPNRKSKSANAPDATALFSDGQAIVFAFGGSRARATAKRVVILPPGTAEHLLVAHGDELTVTTGR